MFVKGLSGPLSGFTPVSLLQWAAVRRGCLWTLMPTTLLALHPQGAACGGADKMHALMKGLARVGAARPRRRCSPEPDVSGERKKKHAASAKSEGVFHFVKSLLKMLIVANVADHEGCFTVRRRMLQTCGENPRQRCTESDASLLSRRENTQDKSAGRCTDPRQATRFQPCSPEL